MQMQMLQLNVAVCIVHATAKANEDFGSGRIERDCFVLYKRKVGSGRREVRVAEREITLVVLY
jgi:hypothetical protein